MYVKLNVIFPKISRENVTIKYKLMHRLDAIYNNDQYF